MKRSTNNSSPVSHSSAAADRDTPLEGATARRLCEQVSVSWPRRISLRCCAGKRSAARRWPTCRRSTATKTNELAQIARLQRELETEALAGGCGLRLWNRRGGWKKALALSEAVLVAAAGNHAAQLQFRRPSRSSHLDRRFSKALENEHKAADAAAELEARAPRRSFTFDGPFADFLEQADPGPSNTSSNFRRLSLQTFTPGQCLTSARGNEPSCGSWSSARCSNSSSANWHALLEGDDLTFPQMREELARHRAIAASAPGFSCLA